MKTGRTANSRKSRMPNLQQTDIILRTRREDKPTELPLFDHPLQRGYTDGYRGNLSKTRRALDKVNAAQTKSILKFRHLYSAKCFCILFKNI